MKSRTARIHLFRSMPLILPAAFPFGRISGMDKPNEPVTDRERGCVRLLFWGAVASSLFAMAAQVAKGNLKGVAIMGGLVVASFLMALYVEWKAPPK